MGDVVGIKGPTVDELLEGIMRDKDNLYCLMVVGIDKNGKMVDGFTMMDHGSMAWLAMRMFSKAQAALDPDVAEMLRRFT